MDRAVDLLVEADVPREALDSLVAADAELAEDACPCVRRERLQQEVLAGLGACVDDLPAFEDEPHLRHLVPEVNGRELAEGHLALDGSSTGE